MLDEVKILQYVSDILLAFDIQPDLYTLNLNSSNFGSINSTYFIVNRETRITKYVLQKLNVKVFTNPSIIENNILLISSRLSAYSSFLSLNYPILTYLTTKSGQHFFKTNDNDMYRMMIYVNNTLATDTLSDCSMARLMGYSYGFFTFCINQCVSPTEVSASIPNFHNLDYRYTQYQTALIASQQSHNIILKNRYNLSTDLIQQVDKYTYIMDEARRMIECDNLPLLIHHHDAKVSNILFPDTYTTSDAALCTHTPLPTDLSHLTLKSDNMHQLPVVIDWDTLMPGYYWSDIGDMIRSCAVKASEDSVHSSAGVDADEVEIQWDVLEAVMDGWKAGVCDTRTTADIAHVSPTFEYTNERIWFAGEYMIYMQLLRYLTDLLEGDVYYTISRPLHNLDRARVHVTILEKISEKRHSCCCV